LLALVTLGIKTFIEWRSVGADAAAAASSQEKST